MSILAKLQTLDAQVTTKILDANFNLDNSLGLLQISAYLSILLDHLTGAGGGGGGAGIDYTSYLQGLTELLDTFYRDESTRHEITNNLLADIDSIFQPVSIDIDTIINQITGIQNQLTSFDAELTTVNTRLLSILNSNDVSLAMTATTLSIAAPSTPQIVLAANPDRKYLFIQNNSDNSTITLGFNASMTIDQGIKLPLNAAFEQNATCIYKGNIYGIKNSGNGLVSIVQGVRI